MKIKVTCVNPLIGYKKSALISFVSYDQKLLEICYQAPISSEPITFGKYYDKNALMYKENCFPYILRNGKYEWSIPYDEISVGEFLNTHELEVDDGLTIETGNVAGDGSSFDFIYQSWIFFYTSILPFIKENGWMLSFGIGVYRFIDIVKNTFSGKKDKNTPKPKVFFEAILAKDTWVKHELAEKLDIDPANAKLWLNIAGFKWDNTAKLYRRTQEGIDRLIEVWYGNAGMPKKRGTVVVLEGKIRFFNNNLIYLKYLSLRQKKKFSLLKVKIVMLCLVLRNLRVLRLKNSEGIKIVLLKDGKASLMKEIALDKLDLDIDKLIDKVIKDITKLEKEEQ